MVDRKTIETAYRASWEARVRGDIEGTLRGFAPQATFAMNASPAGASMFSAPARGGEALRSAIAGLIGAFVFKDFEIVSLIAEGDRAAVHWRAHVTHSGTGNSGVFDGVDLVRYENGVIASMFESFDTVHAMKLAGAL